MSILNFCFKKFVTSIFLLLFLWTQTGIKASDKKTYTLWYKQAASDTTMFLHPDKAAVNKKFSHEALPLGNGSLGCMAYGGVKHEFIEFNEESLWIGDENNTGAYQAFGEFHIDFMDSEGNHSDYRRELDISKSVQTVSYRLNGTNYKREYFASHPAGILVFNFTADTEKAYNAEISLKDSHKATIKANDKRITATGSLKDYVYRADREKFGIDSYDIVLDYEAILQVKHDGGSLRVEEDKLILENANGFTLYLAAGTNYLMDREKNWQGNHPHEQLVQQVNKALEKPYETLLQEHINDYQNLFKRFDLDLGTSAASLNKLSTAERLDAYKKEGKLPDPDLEELLLQYARYLIISTSRPGCLPANLQGIWNNVNNPIWRSDYHSDVNLQMNYWFVDKTNLSECFMPYSDWLETIRPIRREQTKKDFPNIRGWHTHSENGAFGGISFKMIPGDAAWLAQNIWDHYAFTRDKEYLKERAYPLIKELCEYWQDRLITMEDGTLIAPLSKSPEHGPMAEGNSYEQQLIFNLFGNYIEGSEILGIDEGFRRQVADMKSRLLGPQIGKWGQLQEWKEDLDDPGDTHRHVSHMIAVYPGNQISPVKTPDWAGAAKVSLTARGTPDRVTAWGMVWRSCLWSRLGETDIAYQNIEKYISSRLFSNLLSRISGNTFQIDANLGYAEAVCETIVQSHLGEIHLLPGIPENWKTGSVKGLVARGNFSIDMSWEDKKLKSAAIHAVKGGLCKIRSSEKLTIMHNNQIILPGSEQDGTLVFPTQKGETYKIKSM